MDKKYKIEVLETIARVVEVEAKDGDEAFDKVRDMYNKSEIILDSSDFVDVQFSVV